jgi:hypothetical protein
MPTPLVPPRTTSLSPNIEDMYKYWALTNSVPQSNDYDMRGFYLAGLLGDPSAQSGVNASDGQMHYTDTYKLPNHQSFSNESKYSKAKDDPYWKENPAPYIPNTWARISPTKGLLNLDLPFGGF